MEMDMINKAKTTIVFVIYFEMEMEMTNKAKTNNKQSINQ